MKSWPNLFCATLSFGAFLLAGCGNTPSPVVANWHINGNEARQVALQAHRPVLIAFMGSDWSAPCQALQKDVLDTQTFKDFSDASVILVKVDFPRGAALPAEVAQLNAELARQAQVDRLPTFVLVDPRNGSQMGRITDFSGNADAFVAQIRNALAQWQAAQLSQAQSNPAATINNRSLLPTGLPSPEELMQRRPAPGLPEIPGH